MESFNLFGSTTLVIGLSITALGIFILTTGKVPRFLRQSGSPSKMNPNPLTLGIFEVLIGTAISTPALVQLLDLPQPVRIAFYIASAVAAVAAGVLIVRSNRKSSSR